MKLGIITVYIVNPDNSALLDLHLAQIEKHTTVPYTIYAGVNRLLPQFRERLKRHPRVKICPCPDTDLRSVDEHSFYLEHLIKYPLQDDATHIATLHLDSFPILTDWNMKLSEKLNDICSFATLEGINTACLFFHRDYYLKYKPTFLISEDKRSSKEYWQFQKKYDVSPHSGVGFAFSAYLNGLTWHYLKESVIDKEKTKIYDNMIFHLEGVVHWQDVSIINKNTAISGLFFNKLVDFLKLFTPRKTREHLRKINFLSLNNYIDEPRLALEKALLEKRKQKLIADPESYLGNLKNNQQ